MEDQFMRQIKVIIILFVLVAVGCAFDVAHVSYEPVKITSNSETRESFTLNEAVEISRTPCGYKRTLNQYSSWDYVGTIPEGDVYKPRNQVLTVECSNVYEAYVVVSEGFLVGFYLPVESGFVPIKKKIELPVS